MRCPACDADVQLAERVPPSLAGAFAYVACPSAACARDLVASFPEDVEREPRLLTPASAFAELREAARRQSKREVRKVVVIVASVVGGATLMVMCMETLGPSTNPPPSLGGLLAVAFATLSVLLLVRVGFVVDARLGARRWIAGLPRAQLAFVRLPTSYRA
ncbi:MAG TPA: hypothetical protein VIF62_13445 [Labilithrix sp.]|jgi:hypothetical protein